MNIDASIDPIRNEYEFLLKIPHADMANIPKDNWDNFVEEWEEASTISEKTKVITGLVQLIENTRRINRRLNGTED